MAPPLQGVWRSFEESSTLDSLVGNLKYTSTFGWERKRSLVVCWEGARKERKRDLPKANSSVGVSEDAREAAAPMGVTCRCLLWKVVDEDPLI